MPLHLRLPELFKDADVETTDAVTGRRLVLGNDDVRISYVVAGRRITAVPQRDRRRVRVRRGGQRDRRDDLRTAARREQGDYVLLPRATTHRWLPDTADGPLRAYCIEANSHITPARRYLSKFGQLLEHAPFCERDLHGPGDPPQLDGTDVEVYIKHRGSGPSGIAGTIHVVAAPPVRPRRLGRLPLPVHVQRGRLRADHRTDPPTAAGAPGVRGQQLRDLQLRAAQGRLPPAVDPGAVLPLERRLRRGDVLLRRQLRGAQGLGHRAGLGVAASRRALARPAARARTSGRSAPSSSTSSRSWSTRSARCGSARARGPVTTGATPGRGRDAARRAVRDAHPGSPG